MPDSKQLAAEIVEKVKAVVQKGNVTKIVVSKDGKEVVTFPLTVGAVALVVAAPWTILAGVIATLGVNCSVDVVKEDGQVIHIA